MNETRTPESSLSHQKGFESVEQLFDLHPIPMTSREIELLVEKSRPQIFRELLKLYNAGVLNKQKIVVKYEGGSRGLVLYQRSGSSARMRVKGGGRK